MGVGAGWELMWGGSWCGVGVDVGWELVVCE